MTRQDPFKRATKTPSTIRLGQTAAPILAAVSQFGPITSEQLRQLIWRKPSQKTYAESVLRRLFDATYLDRIPLVDALGPPRIAYVLGVAGRRAESERLGLAPSRLVPRPVKQRSYKPLFLAHHLATIQVLINLRVAAEQLGGELIRVITDRNLRRDHRIGAGLTLIPDAYVVLAFGERQQSFVIELDRATKTLRSWHTRLESYWRFQGAPAFRRDYQNPAVLIVIDAPNSWAANRVNGLKRLTERESHGRDPTLFWLATLKEATPEAILTGQIWAIGGKENRYSLLPPDHAQNTRLDRKKGGYPA